MKILLKEIPIKDVVKEYLNDEEEGVVGYGGKLNIHPRKRGCVLKNRVLSTKARFV